MIRSAAPARAEERRGMPPPSRGTRAAKFTPDTYDAAAHTVEAVLSLGARVDRIWFQEELLIDPGAIDLGRVASGQCKLIDSHNQFSIGAILGTVRNARVESGQLLATLFFDQGEAGVVAEGLVARGTLTGISIGYKVRLWKNVTPPGDLDQVDVFQAIDWELMEASLLSVPADANAGIRAASIPPSEPAVAESDASEKDLNEMLTRNAPAADHAAETLPPAAVVPSPVVATVAAPAPAPAAVRAALSQFTTVTAIDFIDMARSFGVEDQARTLVTRNHGGEISTETAREEIMRVAAEKQRAQTHPIANGHAARAADNTEASRNGIIDAFVARALNKEPGEHAREYMGMRMLEVASSRAGLSPRERDPVTILRSANTTSDFPKILEAAANKVLMARYADAAPTYQAIARRRDLTDFKPTKLLRIGDFPTLLQYNEAGEIQAGTVNEGRESVVLASYGRILRLTRQAIVNDDLNAFNDVFGSVGNVIARFENATFFAMKALNSGAGPLLSDGNAVFHTAHANLAASGTVIDIANLGKARAAMRKQKGLDGNVLNIVPKTILVGPDKETEADQIVTSVTPAASTSVNPFSGKLSTIVDGSIVGNGWEVYADPSQFPVFSYGYLADAPGPRVLTEEPFNVDGVAMRVTLDFYSGAIDYRGAYRNAGA